MSTKNSHLDVIIIGAGFAGLYMLHSARKSGLSAIVLEAGAGAGGTWYWNRYPGARCDVPSMEYSYQFDDELQQEWQWNERYASQPEILSYINHIVERFKLADDIVFNARAKTAHFDDATNAWTVKTSTNETYSAQFCVFASGCLSVTNIPDIENRESFAGQIYHTGNWPHEGVDFSGLEVAVVGTGSSGIQSIPLIAEQAAKLSVLQRTPSFTVPAHNHPLAAEEQNAVKSNYPDFRTYASKQFTGNDFSANERLATEMSAEEIQTECDRRWELGGLNWYGAFADLLLDQKTNDIAAKYVNQKMHELVRDDNVALTLTADSVFGCKRLCADTGYYETFNKPNVNLIDLRETPIRSFTKNGMMIGSEDYSFDAVVFATGFDAMTGALNRIDIRGREDLSLKDKWSAGPLTYLGIQTAEFPNMFIITGPGSPSVLTNMLPSIEQHVDFISGAINHLRENEFVSIEASPSAETAWVAHVNEVAASTLLLNCNSWYLGANVPGKPRVFMPYLGYPEYVEKCEQVVNSDYEGFKLTPA
jgi:cation diffusion facilitator CzcD-associated flavoprotein CzcO